MMKSQFFLFLRKVTITINIFPFTKLCISNYPYCITNSIFILKDSLGLLDNHYGCLFLTNHPEYVKKIANTPVSPYTASALRKAATKAVTKIPL